MAGGLVLLDFLKPLNRIDDFFSDVNADEVP